MTYQLTDTDVVVRLADGASIPADPDNADRREYLMWLAAGNTPQPPPIAALRRPKRVEIERAYVAAIEAGHPYGGQVLQLEEEPRQNVQALFARAVAFSQGVAGVTWPAGGTIAWLMKSNTYLQLTPAQAIEMCQGAFDRFSLIRARYRQLKTQLLQANDAADVAAIDPATGWPA